MESSDGAECSALVPTEIDGELTTGTDSTSQPGLLLHVQFSVVQLSAFLAEADEAEWLDEQELVPTEIDGEPGTTDERQLGAWPGL